MKFLLSFLILTGCALPSPSTRNTTKHFLYQEKLKKCTIELIGEHGIEAEKAAKVCRNIYKAK